MTTREEDFNTSNALPEGVLHIAPEHVRQPVSPTSKKRFIVEPTLLNAALEVQDRRASVPPPSSYDRTIGGLSPPPRPHGRKGSIPRSIPVSPVTQADLTIPSLLNSPLSPSYSNSPDTPVNAEGSSNARPSPRLSNILRTDSLLFNSLRRRSLVEPEAAVEDDYRKEDDPPRGTDAHANANANANEELGSPESSLHSSLPSSPEISGMAVDNGGAARQSRQNKYLSGLQKITKLGKTKPPINMFTTDPGGARVSRRMSDVDIGVRRTSVKKGSSGSEDLSTRYRRILDKGVKTAGELIKPSTTTTGTSVPSSPISPGVKNMTVVAAGSAGRAGDGNGTGAGAGTGGTSGTTPSSSATRRRVSSRSSVAARGTRASLPGSLPTALPITAVGPPPRVWLSHGRQPSDMSASLSPASASASDSSHDPSSSTTETRISISSTIYPDSSNNHSFDISRYPTSSAMSPDRESFIDLASPTVSPRATEFQFNEIPTSFQSAYTSQALAQAQVQDPQPIPATFSRNSHDSTRSLSLPLPQLQVQSSSSSSHSSKPRLARLSTSDKPPIPTAPKPDFSYRSRSMNSPSTGNRTSPVQTKKANTLSAFVTDLDPSLPTFSTSNALTARERAERIRTTRKLAQVFGQPPGVSPISPAEVQEVPLPNGCMPLPTGPLALNLSAKRRPPQHRPAVSMSHTDDAAANTTPVFDAAGDMIWPPPAHGTRYVSLARRHSAPLSPDEFSFMLGRSSAESDAVIEIGPAVGDGASSRAGGGLDPGSPLSFMDLSDDEGGLSEEGTVETPRASGGRRGPFSPSTASFADSLSSDQLAEEERRRKREKLAKLHRFLGSRVPPHLVLGPLDQGTPLPPPAPDAQTESREDDDGLDIRKLKMRRRRSSSAAEFSRTWSDDIDRLKEELNEREKAINVRRAVKMEKMFGVAPPQTLYHTRAPVASSPNIPISPFRQPSPLAKPATRSPSTPPFRFTPAGPSSKPKTKKRPGTSESAQPLMNTDDLHDAGFLDVASSVYMHYRHSLNSLNDIIDRDDKESLAELHDYLTGDHYKTGSEYDYQFAPLGPPTAASSSTAPALLPKPAPTSPLPLPEDLLAHTPTTATFKSERRRSLPSRVSISSFSSEISMMIAPTPTEPSFQQRRRRAAKLTHFFGVDYRDLMGEILDSIEKGLEEERGKGTLRPDEVQDLQQKLRSLKSKRNSLLR